MIRLILFFLFALLTACGGQSLVEIAENNLYPYKEANKTKVPETPQIGYQEDYISYSYESKYDKQQQSLKIHVWYYEVDPSKPVVIYSHGNGLNIGGLYEANLLEVFKEFDVNIVVYDYPKWGNSVGPLNQEALTHSGSQVISWAKSRFNKTKVTVWGRSLGAAVASQMVKSNHSSVDRLVLTSGWDTLLNLALHHTSMAKNLPEDWKNKNEWNTITALGKVNVPVLYIHGDKDDLIPFKFGQKVFNAIASKDKKFLVIKDKGHNDIFSVKEFWQSVYDFIIK